MLQLLREAQSYQAALFFLVANAGIFATSVAACWMLGVAFHRRRLFDRREPLRAVELWAAAGAIGLNAGISVLGWVLWKHDVILLKPSGLLRSLADCAVMLLAMDLGMYVFHRAAHLPFFYRRVHAFHHRHETTNPLSLFVLHPVEVTGFGLLMIGFLACYSMSVAGLLLYLTLNVVFGTLGHSGVEPLPAKFRAIPLLGLLGTSTFHAEHHHAPAGNFGFYTLIWDKLFGTLNPEYAQHFDHGIHTGVQSGKVTKLAPLAEK